VVFHIGDEVIHATHGLGKIVHIEEKDIHDEATSCYVVRTPDLTIWVPVENNQQNNLRVPTSPTEFETLFEILSSPGAPLPEDRLERKNYLSAQLRDGQLASICKVVRDLTHFMRTSKLNDQERSILERATKSLLMEWAYSFQVPASQAQQSMESLLARR
jgi:RNA polymerase-interacting CarD/CdnL/TRCF family regulator